MEGDYLRTALIIIGVFIVLLLTATGFSCIIASSDAEHRMEAWEREKNAGRD